MIIGYFEALNISPLIPNAEALVSAYNKAKLAADGDSEKLMLIEMAFSEFSSIFRRNNTLLSLIVSSDDLKAVLNYCSLDDCLSILNYLLQTKAGAQEFIADLNQQRQRCYNSAQKTAFNTAFAYGAFGRVGLYVTAVHNISSVFSTSKAYLGTLFSSVLPQKDEPKSKLATMFPGFNDIYSLIEGLSEGKARAALMFLRDLPYFNELTQDATRLDCLQRQLREQQSWQDYVASGVRSFTAEPLGQTAAFLDSFKASRATPILASATLLNDADKKLMDLCFDFQKLDDAEGLESALTCYGDTTFDVKAEQEQKIFSLVDNFFYAIEYAVCLDKITKDELSLEKTNYYNQRLSDINDVIKSLVFSVIHQIRVTKNIAERDAKRLFIHWLQSSLPQEYQIQLCNALHQTVSADLFDWISQERVEILLGRSVTSVHLAKMDKAESDDSVLINHPYHIANVGEVINCLEEIETELKSRLSGTNSFMKYCPHKTQLKISYLIKVKLAFRASLSPQGFECGDALFVGLCNLSQYICNMNVGYIQTSLFNPFEQAIGDKQLLVTKSLKKLRDMFDLISFSYQKTLSQTTSKRIEAAADIGLSIRNIISLISALQSPTDEALCSRREQASLIANSSAKASSDEDRLLLEDTKDEAAEDGWMVTLPGAFHAVTEKEYAKSHAVVKFSDEDSDERSSIESLPGELRP